MDLNKFFKNNFHIIFIIAAVGLLAVLLYYKNTNQKIQTSQKQEAVSMKSYADPAGYYKISVPADWRTSSGYGSQTTGIGTAQEKKIKTEVSNLTSGKIGFNIAIYGGAVDCDKVKKSNTTLAGFPAYFDARRYTWEIYTTESLITVGYYYPGIGVYHRRGINENKSTPEEMFANQKLINDIAATLELLKVNPLVCP